MNGTAVQQWTCADVPAMTWTLDGQQLKSGGKCMDVEGGATANGTKAHLWDCGPWDSQKWAFQPGGTLKNVKSGRCLDIEAHASRAAIRMYCDCLDGDQAVDHDDDDVGYPDGCACHSDQCHRKVGVDGLLAIKDR